MRWRESRRLGVLGRLREVEEEDGRQHALAPDVRPQSRILLTQPTAERRQALLPELAKVAANLNGPSDLHEEEALSTDPSSPRHTTAAMMSQSLRASVRIYPVDCSCHCCCC